jgi:two-component system response regulator (stage 0 sporulation protein A)
VGIASCGLEALEYVEKHEVDLMLLDLIMPYLDGLGVLERLEELNWSGKVMIMSALGSEELIRLAFSLGVSYYLIKPFKIQVLLDRIKLIGGLPAIKAQSREPDRSGLDQAIAELLIRVGVPPHFKGYLYLRDCIKLVAKDFDRLGSIMKTVYPIVAERYNTTPQKIERTIRHAIETTWQRGNMELLNELFGSTIDAERGKATNTLFIAKLADEIRLKFSLN